MNRRLHRTLRQYILGELAEDARLEVERGLVRDPDMLEALHLVEQDTIDEYLDEVLPAGDKQKFERHLGAMSDLQRRLSFSRTLRTYASEQAVEETPAPSPRLFTRIHPAWLATSAAILLAVASTNVWRSPVSEPATFTLSGDLTRGSAGVARVPVQEEARAIRLRLPLPDGSDATATYRAVLQDADADELWMQSRLTPDASGGTTGVTVEMPARILAAGDYQIHLSSQRTSKSEAIATYTFRVTGSSPR